MDILSILLLIIIGVWIVLAIRHLLKNGTSCCRGGKSCCGNCKSCNGNCKKN